MNGMESPGRGPATDMVAQFRKLIANRSFDIVHEFNTDWYNAVKAAHLCPLPPNKFALLVGNSKALWPRFLEFYRENASKGFEHPFDTFVERSFQSILEEADEDGEDVSRLVRLYFSHHFEPERLVSFQKVAHVSGAATLDETLHLCVHERFGPWFSLRAIVVFLQDDIKPPLTAPRPPAIPLDPAELQQAKAYLEKGLEARRNGGSEAWKDFIEVRGSVSYGREHRYDTPQLLYHYTKSKDVLHRAISGT